MDLDDKNVNNIKDDIEDIVDLKLNQLKLQLIDKLALICNRLMVIHIVILLWAIVLGLVAASIVIILGGIFDSYMIGVLSSIGFVLLCLFVLYLLRKKIFLNSMIKVFVQIFFPKKDDQK